MYLMSLRFLTFLKHIYRNLEDFLSAGQSGRSQETLIEFYFSFKYFTSCSLRWLLRFVSFYGHLSFYCTSTAFCPPIIRFFLSSLSMLKRILRLFHTKKWTFKTELIKRREVVWITFKKFIFESIFDIRKMILSASCRAARISW